MLISEAKTLIGQTIALTYTDRTGQEYTEVTEIYDVAFIPLYGPCMITDSGEVRLDRILEYKAAEYQYRTAA
ncbi:MAG: hypothetical protein JNM28_06630 [Armatimonadetes bacterium]|nr:hypothetical protein [Armatimonadota bacterium]MBS1711682.1 hypothetical protein [Armatimonadota bacterium]MBX3109763.1 hypothetical protein [Fimbriimonadaceae bacterium]